MASQTKKLYFGSIQHQVDRQLILPIITQELLWRCLHTIVPTAHFDVFPPCMLHSLQCKTNYTIQQGKWSHLANTMAGVQV